MSARANAIPRKRGLMLRLLTEFVFLVFLITGAIGVATAFALPGTVAIKSDCRTIAAQRW